MTQPEVIYAHSRNLTSGFFDQFVQNGLKRCFTCEIFASYRNSRSLNPFPVTNLRPQEEFMYLLHMRRHCRHKNHRNWCRAPELAAFLQEKGCAEFKYDVRF